MAKCIYAEKLKCAECESIFYSRCRKFVKAHNTELIKEILPFTYKKQEKTKEILKGRVIYSRDEDLLKSLAADIAVRLKTRIKKLNFNQTISVQLSTEGMDFENVRVIYIENIRKTDNSEKLLTVFNSFVDLCEMKGVRVFYYSRYKGIRDLDWVTVEQGKEENIDD